LLIRKDASVIRLPAWPHDVVPAAGRPRMQAGRPAALHRFPAPAIPFRSM